MKLDKIENIVKNILENEKETLMQFFENEIKNI